MTQAACVAIAEAVRQSLTAAGLSQECAVDRAYDPEISAEELEQLGKCHLRVMPADLEEDFESRSEIGGEHVIHVGVRRKLQERTSAAIDPLVYLVEEIKDHFLAKRLDGLAECFCLKAKARPLYSPRHLQRQGVFFSVLELTFQAVREFS